MNNNELITLKSPKSNVSEGIRTIRTNLQFSAIDKELKTILITSSIPGEGKSFISSNLAITFAQNNNKVLIVDCDMRKGRLHKIFKIKNEKGLSNLLVADHIAKVNDYIVKTSINNLYVLTMGTVPPNPSELLDSEKNKRLIKNLRNKLDYFDYIIFDCVPVNGLTDSLIMAPLVDKVVIVTAVGQTPIGLLEKTKKSLENAGADIAGVVVNKSRTVYNSYYGHYYE